MKNLLKRMGVTLGLLSVMALGVAGPAQAAAIGVGDVETTIVGPNRAVAATGQYQATINANGTRTIVYECAGTAIGDVAATRIFCSISVNGSQKDSSAMTTPGPASPTASTVTVSNGSISLCYQATGYWIDGTSNTGRLKCTMVNVAS